MNTCPYCQKTDYISFQKVQTQKVCSFCKVDKLCGKSYVVHGFTMECIKYTFEFDSFVKAIECYKQCVKNLDTVFIKGISRKVYQKIVF